MRLNRAGQLNVTTPADGFQDDAPIAYQEVDGRRVPVAVEYTPEHSGKYAFRLGAYDPALPLVIDPAVLVYCGYIGGDGDDLSNDITVDSTGNAYVTGWTMSTETTFPVIVGPDSSHNGGQDAFVAKVKADGTGLIYAGYIGGSAYDWGYGITVDSTDNAYVTGTTWSTEATFPVITGPDLTHNGGQDVFVAKLNSDGTGLVYSGYIGGSGNEGGQNIAIDTAGNAYISGATNSNEATFPVSVGPDLIYNKGEDAFVAKVKSDGTGFFYAGYIGGSSKDEGYGIALDSAGNAYVIGRTESTEATFPVKVGPDLTNNDDGGIDGFVAKVSDTAAPGYSLYLPITKK